jgi:hypothetical protein
MRTNPMPPLVLFAAAYLGATLALTQESILLAAVALGFTQVAAALLLARRPALVRQRLLAQAPPRLAEASAGSPRDRGWRLTGALVEHGRTEMPRPLCEPAGAAIEAADEAAGSGPLVFWAVAHEGTGAAVEIFHSRVVAEAALADALARNPAAAAGLSVVRLDFAALAGISAEGGSAQRTGLARPAHAGARAGRASGPAWPAEWIYRTGS